MWVFNKKRESEVIMEDNIKALKLITKDLSVYVHKIKVENENMREYLLNINHFR